MNQRCKHGWLMTNLQCPDCKELLLLKTIIKQLEDKLKEKKISTESIWSPIETIPNNGEQFICWNGEEMQILNQPKGFALGKWSKVGRNWYGSISSFNNPTHWAALPDSPLTTKEEK